jgi:hypothetical protein
MLLGHHNIDDHKQLISRLNKEREIFIFKFCLYSYDEHYNRRGPYGDNKVKKNIYIIICQIIYFSVSSRTKMGITK